MDNQHSVSRVETELNQWRSREERFTKLFSFNLSHNRALLREKLQYYDRIAAKYNGTKHLDERFAILMLRQERNHIERQLYPNLLFRLLRRLLIASIRDQIMMSQENKRVEANSQSLQQQVQRSGFSALSSKIEEQIKLGQQQFSVPVSYYINDKEKLDHQLSFVKDAAGLYRFEGYKTNLSNEVDPEEHRHQFFSAQNGYGVNITEAYNLLSGRAVQKEDVWIQLDFTDKDPQGNFRIKDFHSRYGYDLETTLQQLPLKELLNKAEKKKLQEALNNGDRASVTFLKDGSEKRYYIEANPRFKSVNVYDEHSRKITLHTALGGKTMDPIRVTRKINEQRRQNRAKKNGVRIG